MYKMNYLTGEGRKEADVDGAKQNERRKNAYICRRISALSAQREEVPLGYG